MAPRPRIELGSYLQSIPNNIIMCKAYTAPPGFGGSYITTLEPETYFGPVEASHSTMEFETVLVNGYWINVWSLRKSWNNGDGTNYARMVPWWCVRTWEFSEFP